MLPAGKASWYDACSLPVVSWVCCVFWRRYLDDGCHLALQAIVALVQGKLQSGGGVDVADMPAAATLCMISRAC